MWEIAKKCGKVDNKAMKKSDDLSKLYGALRYGSPIRTALKYAGITHAKYRYWLSIHAVVEYCHEQEEITEMERAKSPMAIIRRRAYETATALDMDGNAIEPDPEMCLLYAKSEKFRDQAEEIWEIIEKCEKAQTSSILSHLQRINNEGTSKQAMGASQWFLERALPVQFGKQEPEHTPAIQPVKVEFIKSDSESSMKRIEDMEKELLGERSKA